MDKLLTTSEVAAVLKVNAEEVCRRIRAGELAAKIAKGPRLKHGCKRPRPTYRVFESVLREYMNDLPDAMPSRVPQRKRTASERAIRRGHLDVIEFV